jgi:hypothetical protein
MLFQMDFFPTLKLLYSVYLFKTIFIFLLFSPPNHFFVISFYVPQNTFPSSSHHFLPTKVFQLIKHFPLSYLSEKLDIIFIHLFTHLYIFSFIYLFIYTLYFFLSSTNRYSPSPIDCTTFD